MTNFITVQFDEDRLVGTLGEKFRDIFRERCFLSMSHETLDQLELSDIWNSAGERCGWKNSVVKYCGCQILEDSSLRLGEIRFLREV